MKILVTGGCGFIGSNFIKYIFENKEQFDIEKIINLDKETYAGRSKNLEHMGIAESRLYTGIKGDICDEKLVKKVFSEYSPELVFNFAAESHVDNSINESLAFIKTNINGTGVLLDAAANQNVEKFVQISTDEVYGSLEKNSESSKENDLLKPRSPYSASKAGAEHLALSYFYTHGLPVIITRSSNNYGPYQHWEKFLPKFITNLILGKKVPLMWNDKNPGLNIRDWLHVEDNCRAIWLISKKGNAGEIYNIAGKNEKTNIEMTRLLLDYFNFREEMIEKVQHRKGHDFRYSINDNKLRKMGFNNSHKNLEEDIFELCKWYEQNKNWWMKE
ncbi:MAG: dTDP-glucose 4,6-dehydratase [Candidatus Pacearchaeota archaeon]|jgi:dTDP-glucose 4,6-dehydratase